MATHQITSDRFAGFPINAFHVKERRSLTVHLLDAGMFDVFADADGNDGLSVFAGRYNTFGEAATVCDGLNRVWRAAPQSTAAEVLAFVGRTQGEALAACEHFRETVHAMSPAERDALPNGIVNTLGLAESALDSAGR